MCEWLKTEWFTIVSIILSGLISWVISAIYFYKGNRSNLQMSVISPILNILSTATSKKNYIELCKISTSYSAKYLHRYEKQVVHDLLNSYKEISKYNDSVAKTDAVISYFEYILNKQHINPKPADLYNDEGEVVADDYPPDFHYLEIDIERVFTEQYLEIEPEQCEYIIKNILTDYAKRYYTKDKLPIFSDYNLETVIKKSKVMEDWKEKTEAYKKKKEKFENLKIVNSLLNIKNID